MTRRVLPAPGAAAPAEPAVFAVALGSNLGPREEHLEAAVAALRGLPGITVEAVSPWLETAPVGGPPGQGPFLNGALVGKTRLGPRALLRVLLAIEGARGRVRRAAQRNGPRTLDLDLLVHGQQVLDTPALTLPHPRLAERVFVLEPLVAIAPWLRVPPSGTTAAELFEALRGRSAASDAAARPRHPGAPA